jgi:transcriptional regulator with XRE-family HTH domain
MDLKLANVYEICQEIGARLRAQRLTQLMRQRELADRAGLSVGAVQSLEKGHSSLESIVRVSQALNLVPDIQELFAMRAPQSIAAMERAEHAKRSRAPRRGTRQKALRTRKSN